MFSVGDRVQVITDDYSDNGSYTVHPGRRGVVVADLGPDTPWRYDVQLEGQPDDHPFPFSEPELEKVDNG